MGFVVTPQLPIRVGRERLRGREGSRVDNAILHALDSHHSPAQVVVFRARSNELEPFWGFAEDLSVQERLELGDLMLREEITLYRRLVDYGVIVLAGVELGASEIESYRHAVERLAHELDTELACCEDEDRSKRLRLDAWLLRNMPIWTSNSLPFFLEHTLPQALPLLEQRSERARELTSAS